MSIKAINNQRKKRQIAIFFFLAAVFAFIFAWNIIQPLNVSPDEQMRYDIVRFMVNHGCIPDARDPEIVNPNWGISYGFYPILTYMVMALPAKLISLFTADSFAQVVAARIINGVIGVLIAYFTLRIGEELFSTKAKYVFLCLVVFLPEMVFVESYVNNDALAVLSSAIIIYVWVAALKRGWSRRLCVYLAIGISLCALSYYNAYGLILCSIIFFFSTLILFYRSERKKQDIFRFTAIVVILVLILAGWWFIRNYILYGDITGWNATTKYAEIYAADEMKPSKRVTLADKGFGPLSLITYMLDADTSWLGRVAQSFIGAFGYMNLFMSPKLTFVYYGIFAAGLVGVCTCIPGMFALKRKDKEKKSWNKTAFLHWSFLLIIIITFLLLIYYNLHSDLQPQGRYLLPMIIPLMYFIARGIERLTELIFKNERLKNAVYIGLCTVLVLMVLRVYTGTFAPAYIK